MPIDETECYNEESCEFIYRISRINQYLRRHQDVDGEDVEKHYNVCTQFFHSLNQANDSKSRDHMSNLNVNQFLVYRVNRFSCKKILCQITVL